MQAIFGLFFQLASVQLRVQWEEEKKKKLIMSCRQARPEVKHPSSVLGEKTKALDIEQFQKLSLFYGRGNPVLEAPVVEQDLLVVALQWWLQEERRVGGTGRCSSRFLLDTWAAWCSILDSE